MTKVNKKLEEKDMQKLINAYVKYKLAEKEFKNLKETIMKDIAEGKYICKKGYINKVKSVRTYIDTNKILEDHPEINEEDYLKETEVVTVTICNLK